MEAAAQARCGRWMRSSKESAVAESLWRQSFKPTTPQDLRDHKAPQFTGRPLLPLVRGLITLKGPHPGLSPQPEVLWCTHDCRSSTIHGCISAAVLSGCSSRMVKSHLASRMRVITRHVWLSQVRLPQHAACDERELSLTLELDKRSLSKPLAPCAPLLWHGSVVLHRP